MNKVKSGKPRPRALMLLGHNLRRLREQRYLSLEELSRLTGIAVKRLTVLETGTGDIRLDSLDRLASALAIPLQELFMESDD